MSRSRKRRIRKTHGVESLTGFKALTDVVKGVCGSLLGRIEPDQQIASQVYIASLLAIEVDTGLERVT